MSNQIGESPDMYSFQTKLLSLYSDLSPTEIKICTLIKMNHVNKDIATSLGSSVRTIETHRSNIRKKMKLELKDSLEKVIILIQ